MAKVVPDWIKRKQELLAMQSQEGKTFSNLYHNLCDIGLIWCAMENILSNKGSRTAGIDGITKDDLKAQEKREELVYLDFIHFEDLNHAHSQSGGFMRC